MTVEHTIFSIMAGLIAVMLFMPFSIYNAVVWVEISEYKVYWLLLINNWALASRDQLIMIAHNFTNYSMLHCSKSPPNMLTVMLDIYLLCPILCFIYYYALLWIPKKTGWSIIYLEKKNML